MTSTFKHTGVLILVLPLCLLFISCNQPDTVKSQEVKTIEVKRTGGVTVDPGGDQLSEFLEGMVVSNNLNIAYGVDLRIMRAYQISLETGEASYLAPEGKGPEELFQPVQISKIKDDELLIFDTGLKHIVKYKNGEIQKKYAISPDNNFWLRNYKGFIKGNVMISAIVEPEEVRAMDFENAKPLAFLDYKKGNLEKRGYFSPTIDKLDTDSKYPVLYYDTGYNTVFYIFITDHTVMMYDLQNDEVIAPEAHKHSLFRTKSSPIQANSGRSVNTAMQNGLSVSLTIGIDRIGDQLVVVWQNFNEGFYKNMGDQSSGNVDYFGVLYDLPDLTNPREFTLPGKFHGVYKDKLLITDNYGAEELQLSFYEFVE